MKFKEQRDEVYATAKTVASYLPQEEATSLLEQWDCKVLKTEVPTEGLLVFAMQCICDTLSSMGNSLTLEDVIEKLLPLISWGPSDVVRPLIFFIGPKEMPSSTESVQYAVGRSMLHFWDRWEHVKDDYGKKRKRAMDDMPDTKLTQTQHSGIFEQAAGGKEAYTIVNRLEANEMRERMNNTETMDLRTSHHYGQAYSIEKTKLELKEPKEPKEQKMNPKHLSSNRRPHVKSVQAFTKTLVVLTNQNRLVFGLMWMIVLKICEE